MNNKMVFCCVNDDAVDHWPQRPAVTELAESLCIVIPLYEWLSDNNYMSIVIEASLKQCNRSLYQQTYETSHVWKCICTTIMFINAILN